MKVPISRAAERAARRSVSRSTNQFDSFAAAICRRLSGATRMTRTCKRRSADNLRLHGSSIAPAVLFAFAVVGAGSLFAAAAPVQTYYVPLPEDDLFNETFETLNASAAEQPVNTLISVAIAADGTIVYYDHWEDGFESDVTSPTQTSTEVWGDMDISNGAPPGVTTDANDVLDGGDAVVLENSVPIPRVQSNILYDGRDRIQASFPIAVTRGAFPEQPGSLMAGAVEVLDTDSWGTEFISPVGENTPDSSDTNPFQSSQLYVMAQLPGTEVFVNGVSQGSIGQGESLLIDNVDQGDVLTTTDPVQVDLVVGDINDTYELRWYSLIPRDDWSNDYYTPVGEEVGSTGIWLYNPNNSQISIRYDREGATNLGPFTVGANSTRFLEIDTTGDINLPDTIGNRSGLRFYSSGGQDFFALTQTDADDGGQIFDWGHPLIPAEQLTSQALIGWGYGCTDNNCNQSTSISTTSRSVVWVAPVAAADINVDFDGDGLFDSTFGARALELIRIRDTGDEDMTGATIFATTSGTTGTEVKIAVAWGQDPARSASGDNGALDLGTTVPPLPTIEAGKSAALLVDANGDGLVSPGDTLRYTIRIVNVGQVDLPAGSWNLLDFASPLFDDASYVPGTTRYDDGGTSPVVIADDSSGTPFPLDEDGLLSISLLPKRGGVHEVFFDVLINDFEDLTPGTDTVINNGLVHPPGNPDDPLDEFEVETPLNFNPSIQISKTVYGGHDSGASCEGNELVTGVPGAAVTYCFLVTNTGDTYLSDIDVEDPDLGGTVGTIAGPLAPGDSQLLFQQANISGDLLNEATATGNPTYTDGTDIVEAEDVTDSDTAEVDEIVVNPAIDIQKTVYLGHDSGASCPGAELALGVNGTEVTYCFEVTNTGDIFLSDIVVDDPNLGTPVGMIAGPLAPGGSDTSLFLDATITGDLTNTATATGNPTDGDGNDIPGVDDVEDSDTAQVDEIAPAIEIQKSPELQTVLSGDTVTFDILVTNTGDVDLTDVTVNDPIAPSCDNVIGDLAAGASTSYQCTLVVTADLTNVAAVTGTPPAGPPVTDSDPADVDVIAPAIEIQKSPELQTVLSGDTVTFDILVTNTGDVDLTDVTVNDPIAPSCDNVIGDLAAGASTSYQCTLVVTADLTNVAAVTGTPPAGPPVTDSDPADVDVIAPAIEIQKSPELQTVLSGDTVTFDILVTNTGDVDLSAVDRDRRAGAELRQRHR